MNSTTRRPKDNAADRAAFSNALGSITTQMQTGEIDDAQGFDQQAELCRSFGFDKMAQDCEKLAKAARSEA